MVGWPVSLWIIWIQLLFNCSAYKASNYNPYRYDIGNVMFTPDGRLLQVEYAIKASEHSAPIYIFRLDKDLVVMACAVNRKNGLGTVLDRLIVLPNHSHKHQRRPSSTIVVSVAGVLADGLALLQKLQEDLLTDFLYFGGTHCPTAIYVAEKLASYCQANCLSGGIRPYGAMVWTLGFGGEGDSELEMFQTSPSGGVQRLHLPDDQPLVLGGGDRSDHALRKLKASSMSPSEAIAQIAKMLSSDETEPEILLLSSSRGALKLSRDQIIQSYLQNENSG